MQKLSPHFGYTVFRHSVLLLVLSKLFFAFFGSLWTVVFRWFRVLVYRNPHPDTLSFLKFFLNFGEGSLRWPVRLFQVRFPPWLKTLATQLVYNLIFLSNFLRGCTNNAYNQLGFSRRYLHNSQRTSSNADNEAIYNAFRNGCL